jgi:hypothetical protein
VGRTSPSRPFPYEFAYECWDYYPKSGKLVWRERPREHFPSEAEREAWNDRYAGRKCGTMHHNKRTGDRRVYVGITYNGRHLILLRSRIAWLLYHRKWPDGFVDHKNRRGDDDSIGNLRDATRSESFANSKIHKHNKFGYKGVSRYAGSNKYVAFCKRQYLGRFDTPREAHQAYMRAAKATYGEFASDGTDPGNVSSPPPRTDG